MNGTSSLPFTVADLQRLLTRAEPAALLVPPRILRRVIKRDRGLNGPGLQVPHHKSYVIERDRLLDIADRDELGVEANRELPPTLLLFSRSDSPCDREAILLNYWRLLFHARIHLALRAWNASDGVQDRIRRIGLTEFDEATAVLRQEHFLLPPGDARTIYEEFAAVYLELRYFSPHLLSVYFPACVHFETIDATLALDVDADALFSATRLEGAPNPAPVAPLPPIEDEWDQSLARSVSEGERQPSLTLRAGNIPRAYRRLLNRADRASARGNMVRAAIFRMRAVPLAPSGQVNPTRAAARREMERFRTRLQKALGYSDEVAGDWRQALFALLEPAAQGVWPVESRMLYDLQKACIDQERPVYAVDLVEWFVTWGRRPIKRLLPFHGSVRMVKHLRSAMHRLTAIRIAKPIRHRLLALLIESTHQGEHRLRERLRPVLRDVLDKVGLTPHHIAEQVARDKLIEELIDRVVEHGFFGMGDLRDAIARNRLKLPDLTGADEPTRSVSEGSPRSRFGLVRSVAHGIKTFFLGDPLIRANRQLAAALDGVYHRGEIYLRWLQRLSAAAFGTHIGRLLTLYVALPFGCSIALLKMWDEVTELIVGGPPEGSEAAKEAAKHINPYAFTLLGLFFLALFHVAPFRRALRNLCVKLWRMLCWLFGDLPARVLRSPWMVRLLQSRTWLFCYQFLLKPLPVAALSALGLDYLGVDLPLALGAGAVVFVVAAFLLNSRLGRYVEEAWTDSLARTWQLIHADLVPGLVRWVIYLFRRLQEEVERIIYTADEWLRFRPGDNRLSLVVKPALGLMWFCFTYVFRVIFNLFVEPTINPIKHFPVVTVTAKLIVPIYKELFDFFKTPIEPLLGKALGKAAAGGAIFLLPGLAGFLVWELKENWRLYRANQSPTLQPEIVGHHGETVLRLMRPGLHSGTLPKLYARLRHAKGRSSRKKYETLHHLGARLRQFVERDLLAVLSGSPSWGHSTPLTPGEIAIATNRIRLELGGPGASVHVDFEEHAGFLVAGLTCQTTWSETWLARLMREQEAAFRDALGGFYKLAGVDVVREQIAALLPAEAVYDLRTEGLVVWPASEENGEFIYPLSDSGELSPQPRGPSPLPARPPLAADALLYSATPIRWADWVQTWQLDHDGKGHAPLLPPRVRLLPALR